MVELFAALDAFHDGAPPLWRAGLLMRSEARKNVRDGGRALNRCQAAMLACILLTAGCAGDVGKPKDWEERSLDAEPKLMVALRTAWHDGHLYYRVTISPASFREPLPQPTASSSPVCIRKGEKYLGTVTPRFVDEGGFTLAEFDVDTALMEKEQDASGRIGTLMAEGKTPLSESLYRALRKWELWSNVYNPRCAGLGK